MRQKSEEAMTYGYVRNLYIASRTLLRGPKHPSVRPRIGRALDKSGRTSSSSGISSSSLFLTSLSSTSSNRTWSSSPYPPKFTTRSEARLKLRDTLMIVVPVFFSGDVLYRTVLRRADLGDAPDRSGSTLCPIPHSPPAPCRDMFAVRWASSSSRVLSVVSPDSRKLEEMREAEDWPGCGVE